jgi:hypothetical protein
MTPKEIEERTRHALDAEEILKRYMPNLIIGLNVEEDMQKLMSTLPDLIDPRDN